MRRNLEGWLFASPWVIGFVLFTVGPMLASGVMAFMKWDLLTSGDEDDQGPGRHGVGEDLTDGESPRRRE